MSAFLLVDLVQIAGILGYNSAALVQRSPNGLIPYIYRFGN